MSIAVKNGDTVALHYTGKLVDGTVFDTSRERAPLTLRVGQKQVIPGFERAVIGMTEGESKTVRIPPAEGFGEHEPAMVVRFDREKIPPEIDVQVGQQLQVQTTAGESLPARVIDASDSDVTLDANHPLAGKTLAFEIELVEIVQG